MHEGGIGACMNRTGTSLRRVRKGVTAAMQSATEQMRRQESRLNDISRSLRDCTKQYVKSLKESREADKYVTAALTKQGNARQSENNLIRTSLLSEPDIGHDDTGYDGPDL